MGTVEASRSASFSGRVVLGGAEDDVFCLLQETRCHTPSRQESFCRLGSGNLRRADLVIPSQRPNAFFPRQLCRGNAQGTVCASLYLLSELLATALLGNAEGTAGRRCQVPETPGVFPSFARDLVYAGSISETGGEDTRGLAPCSPTLLSQVWAQCASDRRSQKLWSFLGGQTAGGQPECCLGRLNRRARTGCR